MRKLLQNAATRITKCYAEHREKGVMLLCLNSAVSRLLPDVSKKKGTKCPSDMTKIF